MNVCTCENLFALSSTLLWHLARFRLVKPNKSAQRDDKIHTRNRMQMLAQHWHKTRRMGAQWKKAREKIPLPTDDALYATVFVVVAAASASRVDK